MMATKIYNVKELELLDGHTIEMMPLKIKYLREFMDEFDNFQTVSTEEDASMNILLECVRIAMKQYYPKASVSIDAVSDVVNMPMAYEVLNYAAGIKVKEEDKESENKKPNQSGSEWKDLDLAKIESEVFLLGIWKDYYELEISMSMPEILQTLSVKRELEYAEKKFLAAMQGVDLDESSGKGNEWEDMKARVFSNGSASDSSDILAFQGLNASKAGFGIGMGLDYEKVD